MLCFRMEGRLYWQYIMFAIFGVISWLTLLPILALIARCLDKVVPDGRMSSLGQEIERQLGIAPNKVYYKKDSKSEVIVKVLGELYEVRVKKVMRTLLAHELEHVANGSADECHRLNCFWGFLLNIYAEYFSFYREVFIYCKTNFFNLGH